MPIEQISVERFITLAQELPVLDVRSPQEYLHAHIPGAFSVPIFTDEQRKIIGTAYKQESRQVAVIHGLNYFSERMKVIPAEVAGILNDWKNTNNHPHGFLIHCWRGGMRSEAVAWLLNLYGYRIYLLKGGYKAFRNWTLRQFDKNYSLRILGGYTGSGKTEVLTELKKRGAYVIDLEKLAHHKGSAFGALGEIPQPTQEMFENLLAIELWKYNCRKENSETNAEVYTKIIDDDIWLEDESKHIGSVGIPNSFWNQMRQSKLYFLEIPVEERLNYIVDNYGKFDNTELINSILKIQKRLGGLETKNAINFLLENKVKECFAILMQYYDKLYTKGLFNRENIQSLLNKISCKSVDIMNVEMVLESKSPEELS